uniref:Uncharacterized protein n=1 Tax=Lotus japonicus TaxID=34305 RepID=I3SEJ5_LOTJA|nr:unknown [Lotus japonicus]
MGWISLVVYKLMKTVQLASTVLLLWMGNLSTMSIPLTKLWRFWGWEIRVA